SKNKVKVIYDSKVNGYKPSIILRKEGNSQCSTIFDRLVNSIAKAVAIRDKNASYKHLLAIYKDENVKLRLETNALFIQYLDEEDKIII
ncbi:MAG: hypothetical protein MHPSP_002160, partial [Paramarteilia canceri]